MHNTADFEIELHCQFNWGNLLLPVVISSGVFRVGTRPERKLAVKNTLQVALKNAKAPLSTEPDKGVIRDYLLKSGKASKFKH